MKFCMRMLSMCSAFFLLLETLKVEGRGCSYSYLLPLVVVALEQVCPVLDRHYDGAAQDEFRFWRQGQIYACGEGDDGCERRFAGIFVVAEGAIIEDAVQFLEIRDGGVFEIDVRFLDAPRELVGVGIEVVVVRLCVYVKSVDSSGGERWGEI